MANPTRDVSAAVFFEMAREYQEPANQLPDLNVDTPFSNPIAFLYFHAGELALKAFLRSLGCPILGTPGGEQRREAIPQTVGQATEIGGQSAIKACTPVSHALGILKADVELMKLMRRSHVRRQEQAQDSVPSLAGRSRTGPLSNRPFAPPDRKWN